MMVCIMYFCTLCILLLLYTLGLSHNWGTKKDCHISKDSNSQKLAMNYVSPLYCIFNFKLPKKYKLQET